MFEWFGVGCVSVGPYPDAEVGTEECGGWIEGFGIASVAVAFGGFGDSRFGSVGAAALMLWGGML